MTLKTGKLRAQLKRLFVPPETKQFFSTKAQKYIFLNQTKNPTFHVSTLPTSPKPLPLPTISEDKIQVTCSMDTTPPAMSADTTTPTPSLLPSNESDSSGNVATAGQVSSKNLESKDSKEIGSKSSFKGLMKRFRKGSISKKKDLNGSSEIGTPTEYTSSLETYPSSDIEEPIKTKPSSFLNPSEEELQVEEIMYIMTDFAILMFFLILFLVVTILVLIRLEEEIDSMDWTGLHDTSNSLLLWIPSPL